MVLADQGLGLGVNCGVIGLNLVFDTDASSIDLDC